AAAAGGDAAAAEPAHRPGQAGRGGARCGAAERLLHRRAVVLGARLRRRRADRTGRGGVPGRCRDRLGGADPGRLVRGRGGAVDRAGRCRDGQFGRDQRGVAVPAGHLLAAGAGRLAGLQLAAAQGRDLREDGAVTDVRGVRLAAAELAGKIRDRGAEIEHAGTLPADIVAGLHDCGVFRLWLPVELGGLEAEPADVLAIVQLLAEADGSTGWCAATGLASNVAGGVLPEAGARQLFPTGSELCGGALMPGGRAVPQDGGFLVDGRWTFGSGTRHCDWIVGGALVAGTEVPT